MSLWCLLLTSKVFLAKCVIQPDARLESLHHLVHYPRSLLGHLGIRFERVQVRFLLLPLILCRYPALAWLQRAQGGFVSVGADCWLKPAYLGVAHGLVVYHLEALVLRELALQWVHVLTLIFSCVPYIDKGEDVVLELGALDMPVHRGVIPYLPIHACI